LARPAEDLPGGAAFLTEKSTVEDVEGHGGMPLSDADADQKALTMKSVKGMKKSSSS
jgi:hypothetical protein